MLVTLFHATQIMSVILTIVSLVLLALWAKSKPEKARIAILPATWLLHTLLFYAWVFFVATHVHTTGSFWSAFLRLQGAVVAFVMVSYQYALTRKIEKINGSK